MIKSLTLCAAGLLSAGLAQAATVWNPAANGISPPAAGYWNTTANWTAGLPGLVGSGDKAVFNVSGAADYLVTNAQSFNPNSAGRGATGRSAQSSAGQPPETTL